MGKGHINPIAYGMFLALVLPGLLSGCAGRRLIAPTPPWYMLKSGMYNAAGDRVFYGIGQAGGVQNPMLLRATADNRARRELSAVLEDYVNELARSAALGSDPDWASLSDGEHRQILGSLVHNALQRAVISDHWGDSQEPTVQALCKLDLADFMQILSDSGQLDPNIRRALRAEAETVHARLSQKL